MDEEPSQAQSDQTWSKESAQRILEEEDVDEEFSQRSSAPCECECTCLSSECMGGCCVCNVESESASENGMDDVMDDV